MTFPTAGREGVGQRREVGGMERLFVCKCEEANEAIGKEGGEGTVTFSPERVMKHVFLRLSLASSHIL